MAAVVGGTCMGHTAMQGLHNEKLAAGARYQGRFESHNCKSEGRRLALPEVSVGTSVRDWKRQLLQRRPTWCPRHASYRCTQSQLLHSISGFSTWAVTYIVLAQVDANEWHWQYSDPSERWVRCQMGRTCTCWDTRHYIVCCRRSASRNDCGIGGRV